MQRPIYLDHHATTPVDPHVLEAMLPYFSQYFGNPGSTHIYGWEAESAVKQARGIIAEAIASSPEEIIFTSGATESNNLAIKGVAEAYLHKGRHIITLKTEHSAVLDPCAYLASLGFEISYLDVKKDGLVDLVALEQAMRTDTILVSIMAANNEIGVIQPLAAIGNICRSHNVLFHTDAAQAIAKMNLNVEEMKIDLMSITGHKVYAPKGIGALYVRRKQPRVNIAAQLHGGGQEKGMRSGTLYPPQIVGLGTAIAIALETQTSEQIRIQGLRDQLWELISAISGIYLNGHLTQRLSGNLNVSVAGVNGNALLLALQPMVAVSSGSACASEKMAPSHVLSALGVSEALSYATVRFGIGRFNTESEILQVADHFVNVVKELRNSSAP
jgi:cysteine desulfurase